MALEFNNNDLVVNSLSSRRDITTTGNVLAGVNNTITPNLSNIYVLGSNIVATLSSFTYVNNLSATGNLVAKNLNNIAISLGSGDQESNLAIGVSALNSNTLGSGNIAVGRNALARTTGGVLSIVLQISGLGYASSPTVIISGGGAIRTDDPTTNATAVAFISGNIVPTFSAVSNSFPISALSANPNYSATFQAITTFNGLVNRIEITGVGLGYYTTPFITLSGGFINTQLFDRNLQGVAFTTTNATATAAMNFPSNNVAIGFNAGTTISLGGDNILIGTNAGSQLTVGNNNTVVGGNNVLWANSNNNTILGYSNYVSGFNNTIIIGNNLSANKSNFAFMSALDVQILQAEIARIGNFLNVDESGLSATNLFANAITATRLTVGNYDGRVSITQLAVSGLGYENGSQVGQTIVYTGSAWVPSFSITDYPGTRLFDFQLTSFSSGMQIVTAETTYCGVAPVLDNTAPAVSSFIWRVTRVKFNDGGSPYETAVSVNIPWTSRYNALYTIINN